MSMVVTGSKENRLRIKKIDKKALLQYLFIYLAIQFVGGRFIATIGSDAFIAFCLVAVGIFVLSRHRVLSSRDSMFLFFLVLLLASMFITVLLTRGGLSIATTMSLMTRLLLVYTAMTIDRDKFLERFLKMTYVFAITSLILFAFVIIAGQSTAYNLLFSKLYEVKNTLPYMSNSYGIFFICYNFMNGTRNSYMFGEPGEYQMLICLALYFVIYKAHFLNRREKNRYLIVFFITLLTIQSTTGYFNLIAIVIAVLLGRAKDVGKNTKRVLLFAAMGVLMYLIFFGEKSIPYADLVGKLYNASGQFDLGATTGADRVRSINDFVRILRTTPSSLVFGVGYSGIVALRGGFSCSGIINTFIMLGFFSCLILYGFLLSWTQKYTYDMFEYIFLLFMVINNGLSQPDLLAITTVIVACYGPLIQRFEAIKESEDNEREASIRKI